MTPDGFLNHFYSRRGLNRKTQRSKSMLKGKRNAVLVEADDLVLRFVYQSLQFLDEEHHTSMGREFFYVFLDENAYTMEKIGELTGNNVCTIRRHVRYFNSLINRRKQQLKKENFF